MCVKAPVLVNSGWWSSYLLSSPIQWRFDQADEWSQGAPRWSLLSMASPYCPLFDWSHWSHYSWLSNNWSMVFFTLKANTAVAGRGAEDESEKDLRGFPCRCLPLSWGYLFFRLSPTNERLNFLENWGAKGDDGRREHKAGGSCHGDDISIMVTMVITGVVMIKMIKKDDPYNDGQVMSQTRDQRDRLLRTAAADLRCSFSFFFLNQKPPPGWTTSGCGRWSLCTISWTR